MFAEDLLIFHSTRSLWIAIAIAIATLAIVLMRSLAWPRVTFVFMTLGMALLALAAGEPIWQRPTAQIVTVMVDLSASTRTADYRDRAALDRRIQELLPRVSYRVRYFAGQVQDNIPAGARLADLPCDHTVYVPPSAAAVLLFSDCRFALPVQSPPAYVVVDTGLEEPEDAAVDNLEIRGRQIVVWATNSGSTRQLSIGGAADALPTTLPSGSQMVTRSLAPGASAVSAELSPGDAWPENDMLSATVPPPGQLERWWIGSSPPGGNWHVFLPADLPTAAEAYLLPGVIVLENVSAAELSAAQQERLRQYVHDLGGGLLILGGDHAFAAGGYEGTILDSLSPLASDPPVPTNHWVLLVDSSGSMSGPAAGATRWKLVTDSVTQLFPRLPPEDVASVGSFSQALDWWAEGKPVRQLETIALPPASAYPHGATNLQPALEEIARRSDGKTPVQLLVLSDFDTQVNKPSELAATLKAKHIHLHLLAIGEGTALPSLKKISAATGGVVMTQFDPAKWAESARELARAAGSKLLEQESTSVTFSGEAAGIKPIATSLWNRVWVKESAGTLADTRRDSQTIPMAARWNLGEGRVLGVAFDRFGAKVESLADLVARPPHDPRFHLTWETGPQLRVAVDAVSNDKYLNGRNLTLELTQPGGAGIKASATPVAQTGPGRYELSVPAPRSPGLATVRAGRQIIGRIAVAGRYAPEFDAVGNDHAAMRELAARSGGELVPPSRTTPLEIQWQRQPVSLISLLATAGAACIAFALIWWHGVRGTFGG
jgi:hypothetical protein